MSEFDFIVENTKKCKSQQPLHLLAGVKNCHKSIMNRVLFIMQPRMLSCNQYCHG